MFHEKYIYHKTNNSSVLGKIEKQTINTLEGWVFHYDWKTVFNEENIRTIIDGNEYKVLCSIERRDVSKYYNDICYIIKNCGFICNIPSKFEKLEIQYKDQHEWKSIWNIETPPLKISKNIPQLIVVDNFYENPDEVRNYALRQEFITNITSHKGRRTTKDFNDDSVKKRFEELLGKPITKWDYKWNGCFQYCIAEDLLVIHCDKQRYAAMVYLHPDAPCSTGTSFWRHKEIKCQYYRDGSFKNGNYDFTPFEEVDRIGNIYNRLVIFDAQMIHSASQYFGKELTDSRLFQIFFFDI